MTWSSLGTPRGSLTEKVTQKEGHLHLPPLVHKLIRRKRKDENERYEREKVKKVWHEKGRERKKRRNVDMKVKRIKEMSRL